MNRLRAISSDPSLDPTLARLVERLTAQVQRGEAIDWDEVGGSATCRATTNSSPCEQCAGRASVWG